MGIVDAFAVVASGVTAGVYVGFAARVMPRLARQRAPEGLATMQKLNRTIVRSPFIAAFVGGGVLGGYQLVRLFRDDPDVANVLAGAAGAAYLAGFVLTVAYNVPRNDRLERLGSGDGAVAYWPTYQQQWNRANAVRAVLSSASVGLGIAALVAEATG